MNYDKIILELLSRVQTLEEDVAILKSNQRNLSEEIDPEFTEGDEMTRSQAREIAMSKLKTKFPSCVLTKATRAEGSGIKIAEAHSKETKLIKFYYSRTYDSGSSWYTIQLDEIKEIVDYCLFAMYTAGEWNYFIFNTDDLVKYSQKNREDQANKVHLYFTIENNKAYEVRENKIDITEHWNNWDIIKI